MIGAYLANSMGAGFLGGMAAGLIAGVVVKQLKRIKLPISLKTLGSIFIYPLVLGPLLRAESSSGESVHPSHL